MPARNKVHERMIHLRTILGDGPIVGTFAMSEALGLNREHARKMVRDNAGAYGITIAKGDGPTPHNIYRLGVPTLCEPVHSARRSRMSAAVSDISAQMGGESTVGELARLTGHAYHTVRDALYKMLAAGVVSRRKDPSVSNRYIYRMSDEFAPHPVTAPAQSAQDAPSGAADAPGCTAPTAASNGTMSWSWSVPVDEMHTADDECHVYIRPSCVMWEGLLYVNISKLRTNVDGEVSPELNFILPRTGAAALIANGVKITITVEPDNAVD